jgi:hypothetical protein
MSIHAFGVYFGIAVAMSMASAVSYRSVMPLTLNKLAPACGTVCFAGGSMSIHAFGAYLGLAHAIVVAFTQMRRLN